MTAPFCSCPLGRAPDLIPKRDVFAFFLRRGESELLVLDKRRASRVGEMPT